jgi:hypothetical protein
VSTFSELTNEVLSHQFSPSQYTTYIQARLNQGQAYIAAQTDFRQLQAAGAVVTAADNSIYSMSSDFLPVASDFQRVYTVALREEVGPSLSQYVPLQEIQRSQLDLLPVSSGQPTHYCIDADDLKVWPTPDSVYVVTMRYYKKPATMVNADDEPEIPGTYHHLLVSYALWHCYERENDYNSAMYHKGRFDEDIMKCRGEVQYDSDDYSQSQRVGDNRTDPLAPSAWVL